ncbi:MAG: aminotransferase class I/II-fold pyridoxal phosphate-dependent enzyme [Anaerolineae bacterium]|nr:aminotransferase class I/II-fold pyridoxal phosphate-dependent enzyme [Anaerolineae bacterium]
MKPAPFALERYFARHEFSARYLLSPSDCESPTMHDLLALGDAETRGLWDRLTLGYTESPGHPLLRETAAAQYAGLGAQHILTAAPEEAIFIAMNVLLEPGDRVILLTPAYQSLGEVARALGCRVEAWSLRVENGAWALDLPRLRALLAEPARLVVVNFPNNPTGTLPTAQEWRELTALVERAGAWLFADEMYRMLELDPARRLEPACLMGERAVSLAGLSKAHGLPGLRTGWLACRDRKFLADCQAFKDYTTICAAAPAEILSIIALRAGDTLLERNRARVAENLAAARAFFQARPQRYAWLEPDGGSIAFPRRLAQPAGMAWADDLVQRLGVMVVPGSLFAYDDAHFRVGLGRANLPEILALLEDE